MTLKRRIADLEEGVPSAASLCCLLSVPGVLHCLRWEHKKGSEPPCRRTGGEICEAGRQGMGQMLEAIPEECDFEEHEL